MISSVIRTARSSTTSTSRARSRITAPLYRAYLQDQDLQDARARWPFVPVWDNHEFSWLGYQGMQFYDGKERPAQTKKVFANQAWWEYQPARVAQPKNGIDLTTFTAPAVSDAPIEKTDAEGFGDEPNNRAAVASLKINRAFRYGKNTSVILTDNRSLQDRRFRSVRIRAGRVLDDGGRGRGTNHRRRPQRQRRQAAGHAEIRRQGHPEPRPRQTDADVSRIRATRVVDQ